MFSSIVTPITSLTMKNVPFVWTAVCQTALDTIKHFITYRSYTNLSRQTVQYPNKPVQPVH